MRFASVTVSEGATNGKVRAAGAERAALVAVVDGQLRDLTAADPSLGSDVGALLAGGAAAMDRARALAPEAPVIATVGAEEDASVRYLPVVPTPGKVLCLGLNDVDHAAEAGLPIPTHPVVFARVASSLIGHGEPMLRPSESAQLDYEAELAVVIGTGGRRIPESEALDHVAGYTVFNDGSIRDYQLRTAQWMLGKNFHGTGALGPWLTTADAVRPGAHGLRMTTTVGDEVLQDGNTGSMIFGVAKTVAYLSTVFQLEPGDVIAMGTPKGIGFARTPPRYLKPGETCRVAIEQLGEIANPIVDDATTSAGATAHPVSESAAEATGGVQ